MDNIEYVVFERIKLKNRKRATISPGEALRDIISFQWSEEVLNGTRKITIK